MQIEFHPVIQTWFEKSFKQASPPQREGWPAIGSGKNTLILAPTGSGKTLAAFLWCIDEIYRQSQGETSSSVPFGVHTLYISPLKALNNDIQRNLMHPLSEIQTIADQLKYKAPQLQVLVRTGDTPPHLRQSMVKDPPHILITTPESLFLLLTSEKGRKIFKQVRYIIIDEIHAMCSNKRGVHLSLSLERLCALCETNPIRIGLSATQKPLNRIADFLGGSQYTGRAHIFRKRQVHIIDCGQKKDFDLKVTAPVPDYQDLPESSVWPAVILNLYRLISEHQTTLIFVNMRAQAEKVARLLNELHRRKTDENQPPLAFPHHGSMSREKRYDIERRLKKGQIRAVIATASLELGIDIGSIDLVVQLETPRSVSAALQRVGRSGHLLNQPSKGRLIPLYVGDLDDSAAILRAVLDADIEETVIPQNCLDVLAQQILAELAFNSWNRVDLFHLVRQSYCYRSLTETAFNRVLEMLNGRYADTHLPALQQRINWDQVNDHLIARSGARLMAVLNGGTIPDRGYYAVYLSDGNTRIGEMEEEFVFESRVGDVFYLGNNEWRIEAIQQDRLIVSPFNSVKPRAPFWKGELPARDYHTSIRISSLREKIAGMLHREDIIPVLAADYYLDENTAYNLVKYLSRQKAHTHVIPSHRHIVAELFRDTAGEKNLVLHACFGARINAAWSLALTAQLEQQLGCQVQYTYNDDGILFRIIESSDGIPFQDMFRLSSDSIERLVIDSLPSAPVFAIQFRYNAARSLILKRSVPGKRIPLWLQRLRAADLLQAVKKFPDFPVLAETYRSCLEDIFDLPHLKQIIDAIHSGEIQTHIVESSMPSPMASGLIFNFVTSEMYQLDHLRKPGEVASFSSSLLTEIMSSGDIPQIIEESLIVNYEQRWQFEDVHSRAKNKEDLFEIIEKLGPVDELQLQNKSNKDPQPWLQELENDGRIHLLTGPINGWISSIDKDLFCEPVSPEQLKMRLRRMFRISGPLHFDRILSLQPFPSQRIQSLLDELVTEKSIIKGELVANRDQMMWCDPDNFAVLYRAAVVKRRERTTTADSHTFLHFQLAWHHCSGQPVALEDLLYQYEFYPFDIHFFEQNIIRSRLRGNTHQTQAELNRLISSGKFSICGIPSDQAERQQICFIPRGHGHMREQNQKNSDLEKPNQLQIVRFLEENGASFLTDLLQGTGLAADEVHVSLSVLCRQGIVSCDDYDAFISAVGTSYKKQTPRKTRHQIRSNIKERLRAYNGRWYLISSFSVQGKSVPRDELALKQARLLLTRYGIVVKEWYRREKGLLPWFEIFQALKQLEWRGEILRGYFIHGLSGIQFALPQAIQVLEEANGNRVTQMLATVDPACPFGGLIPLNSMTSVDITRTPQNHVVIIRGEPYFYCENYMKRIFGLQENETGDINQLIHEIKSWLLLPNHLRPRRKITIETIDSIPAGEHVHHSIFISNGFEKDLKKLILWPSAV